LDVAVLTLFPRMVAAPLAESILGKAQEKGLVRVRVVDVRDYADGKHRVTDDVPYGGGAGMVMKPEPLVGAIESARSASPGAHVVLLTPQGTPFDQRKAEELSRRDSLVLVCGRYEGVDERVVDFIADREFSVGDYVLSGGELAAAVIVDAVTRLIPGAVGNEASTRQESFTVQQELLATDGPQSTCASGGLLDYPHYTRPADFRGISVPEVLVSGDHEQIRIWRRRAALEKTIRNRPDLLEQVQLSDEDQELLAQIRRKAEAVELAADADASGL
jgi:tRNA (guanine37-N1)-methyltransferase